MSTPTIQSSDDNIIARCGGCQRIIFAAANLPDVMDAKMYREIGKLVAEGYTIEHMPSPAVRAAAWGCKCKESPNLP